MLLSEREKQIIQLIKAAPTIKVIAEKIGISYRTTQWHLGRIYAKYHVKNRLELILELMNDDSDDLVR